MANMDDYRDEEGFIRLIPRHPITKVGSNRKLFNRTDTKEVVLHHGFIAITNYKEGDCWELEKSLSIWDKVRFRYRRVAGWYVPELQELRLPRGYDLHLLAKFLPGYNFRVENDPYQADKIDIELYTPPRDDMQKVALTFMTSQGVYEQNHKFTQQLLEMATGTGKSYAGIASICYWQHKAVIIVPFSKLLKQWRDCIYEYTSLKDKDVLCVQGSDTCKKIIEGKYSDVKVFIIMADTIASFQERFGNCRTMDLFEAMHCYVKIVDEVHRDLKAISMIEALSNFRMNYYMSASPGRSDNKENWIFKTMFRNVPHFGGDFRTDQEKHINVMVKRYYWTPDAMQIKAMVNPRTGLNTKAYERELINSPASQRESFDESLRVMLNWAKKILVKKNKILILAQAIDTLYYIQKIAEEIFPDKTAVYYGGLKPKEKEEALKAQVIIATSSSLGTGADIKGLQFNFNVSTYSNKIDAIQLSGRTRKMDSNEVVYCELVNFGYLKTARQFEKRKPYLLKQAKHNKLIFVN
jgi:superfamily II DNA or RNA helicase